MKLRRNGILLVDTIPPFLMKFNKNDLLVITSIIYTKFNEKIQPFIIHKRSHLLSKKGRFMNNLKKDILSRTWMFVSNNFYVFSPSISLIGQVSICPSMFRENHELCEEKEGSNVFRLWWDSFSNCRWSWSRFHVCWCMWILFAYLIIKIEIYLSFFNCCK